MTMPFFAATVWLAILAAGVQAAPVWKCQEGDRVVFSDTPFPRQASRSRPASCKAMSCSPNEC